jgi:hypothetical protein
LLLNVFSQKDGYSFIEHAVQNSAEKIYLPLLNHANIDLQVALKAFDDNSYLIERHIQAESKKKNPLCSIERLQLILLKMTEASEGGKEDASVEPDDDEDVSHAEKRRKVE